MMSSVSGLIIRTSTPTPTTRRHAVVGGAHRRMAVMRCVVSARAMGPSTEMASTRAERRRGVEKGRGFASKSRPNRGEAQKVQSFFGVGAPEALVIGVVSLLVFGPKGLADIAKQLGAVVREFQPTIKELQEVSREFQDTLRDEIEKPLEDTMSAARGELAGDLTPKKREKPAGEPGAKDAANVQFDMSALSPTEAEAAPGDVDVVTPEMKAKAEAMAWGTVDAPTTPDVPADISASDVDVDVGVEDAGAADADVGAADIDAGAMDADMGGSD